MIYTFSEEKLAFLRNFLSYDPELGVFCRKDGKNRQRKLKNPEATAKTYKQINVNGTIYYAHILAYWFMEGKPVPEGMEIDHWDRDKQNCKWNNLRVVTSGLNKNNRQVRKECRAGIKGVTKHSGNIKWSVYLRVGNITYNLGKYFSLLDAARARVEGEKKYLGYIVSADELAIIEAKYREE